MDKDNVFRTLTRNEAIVLFWKCFGLKYKEIGEKLNYSVAWVQAHMSNIYKKLGFDEDMHWTKRVEVLDDQFCDQFLALVGDDEKNLESWIPDEDEQEPKSDPEMYALVIYDEMRALELRGEKALVKPEPIKFKDDFGSKAIIRIEEMRRRNRRRTLFLSIFALILVFIALYIGYRIGQGDISVDLVPTETPTQTITEENIEAPPDTPELTITLEPTHTPVTPSPTYEPSLTPTSSPTSTITPIPDDLSIGDTVSDERVSLRLDDVAYSPKVGSASKTQFVASYTFTFANISNKDVFLQLPQSKFLLIDNKEREFECWIFRYPHYNDEINIQLNPGSEYEFDVACGPDQKITLEMQWLKLHVYTFTSLPEMDWVADIPR